MPFVFDNYGSGYLFTPSNMRFTGGDRQVECCSHIQSDDISELVKQIRKPSLTWLLGGELGTTNILQT